MKIPSRTNRALATIIVVLAASALGFARPAPPIPNPVLIFTGAEPFQLNGRQLTRYHFSVFNQEVFPLDLFAASPTLPPCGANTRSSRTWVDLYESNGKRLNGFCALGTPGDLDKIWFALDSDVVPPSWIYIELTDRLTNTRYKSNLAETTL